MPLRVLSEYNRGYPLNNAAGGLRGRDRGPGPMQHILDQPGDFLMPITAAMPGAYFRVGVATVPTAPRYYRERRACAPCGWGHAVLRLARSELRAVGCRVRRFMIRQYAMALVDEHIPARLLPFLARPLFLRPPF